MIGVGLSLPQVGARNRPSTEAWFDNLPGIDFTVGRTSAASLSDPASLPTSGAAITKSNTVNRVDINTVGTTLANYDCRGWNVRILANNCTVTQCLFNGFNLLFGAVRADSTISGVTVSNCTFDAEKLSGDLPTFIWIRGGTGHIVYRNWLKGFSADGMTVHGGTISENYIYGGGYNAGSHSDGATVPQTTDPILFTHNVVNIFGDGDQPEPDPGDGINNCLRLTDEAGTNVLGVTVTQNLFLGGTYCNHASSTLENVVITDNRYDDFQFGAMYPIEFPADLVWSNNVDHSSGATIDFP